MGSILVNNREISRKACQTGWKDTEYDVIGRKVKCGHVWCPVCGREIVKKASRVLRGFDRTRTRQVVLTVDRRKFPDGSESAYNYVSEKKIISEFIKSLKRQGVVIRKHKWFLEWHGDGFPHWHVFIEVDQQGVAGKIGNARIRKAWVLGGVREIYYATVLHWERLVGYFMKTGYLEKSKQHQTKLPEWGMKSKKRIRRHGGSVKENEISEIVDRVEKVEKGKLEWFPEWVESDKKADMITRKMFAKPVECESKADEVDNRTNEQIINSCGMKTEVMLLIKGDNRENAVFMKVGLCGMPYSDFKTLDGEYLPTLGYRVRMDVGRWENFYSIYIAT